eukprot:gene30516-35544_t
MKKVMPVSMNVSIAIFKDKDASKKVMPVWLNVCIGIFKDKNASKRDANLPDVVWLFCPSVFPVATKHQNAGR